jgi:hypothetical protein
MAFCHDSLRHPDSTAENPDFLESRLIVPP